MNVRAVAFALSSMTAMACSGGCVGVARAVQPLPRLFVAEEYVGPKGISCDGDVDVRAGALPDGAVVLARYHVTTTEPVPLQQVLDLLAVYGRRRCADGVRVLRADVADGAGGIIAAEAVAWALPSS
jgi:hypothetical protein